MPRQRAKRKAAPVELRDLDPTENITEGHAPTTSIPVQKRARQVRPVNVTDVPPNIQNHDEPRSQTEVPLQGSLQSQVPTADQIAASLMQQLKDSGFQLVNRSDNVQSSNITDNTLAGIFQTRNSNQPQELTPVNQRQQHSVGATLIPPLFSDPDMLNVPSTTSSGIFSEQLSSLNLSHSSMGNTASFVIKNTLPLGFNVNNDVKSKIGSDQFVDFYKLLPNLNEEEDDDDVLFKTSTVKIT